MKFLKTRSRGKISYTSFPATFLCSPVDVFFRKYDLKTGLWRHKPVIPVIYLWLIFLFEFLKPDIRIVAPWNNLNLYKCGFGIKCCPVPSKSFVHWKWFGYQITVGSALDRSRDDILLRIWSKSLQIKRILAFWAWLGALIGINNDWGNYNIINRIIFEYIPLYYGTVCVSGIWILVNFSCLKLFFF